jgi:hypothetical protein
MKVAIAALLLAAGSAAAQPALLVGVDHCEPQDVDAGETLALLQLELPQHRVTLVRGVAPLGSVHTVQVTCAPEMGSILVSGYATTPGALRQDITLPFAECAPPMRARALALAIAELVRPSALAPLAPQPPLPSNRLKVSRNAAIGLGVTTTVLTTLGIALLVDSLGYVGIENADQFRPRFAVSLTSFALAVPGLIATIAAGAVYASEKRKVRPAVGLAVQPGAGALVVSGSF